METQWSRVAGIGLLGTFVAVMLEHGVAQNIGGVSLYGVHDAATVVAFYAHPALGPLYWLCAGLLSFFVMFGVGVRHHLKSCGAPLAADLAFAFVVVEAPLLFAHYGLDVAMVDFASSNDPSVMLALLGAWSGVYHWVVEWIEVGWVACVGVAAWRTGALPRWSAAGAGLAALGLTFNMVARLAGLPEAALMPTYGVFSLWMLATGIALVRRRAPRVS